MKKEITVLLGAGAVIEIGGPTTDNLTRSVLNTTKNPLLKHIYDEANKYFNNKKIINFEDLMHLLEQLHTYSSVWSNSDPKSLYTSRHRAPMLTPFIRPIKNKYLNDGHLILAREKLITTIAEEIYKYTEFFKKNEEFSWYRNFWQSTSHKLNITNLNYDLTLEFSLGKNINDGFIKHSDGYSRFDPKLFYDTKKHKLGHLHGCITYGYPANINNIFSYEDRHEDLYKLSSYQEAKKNWFNRSTNHTQDLENIIIGPIITGLRKTEKVNASPYIWYLENIMNAIIKNRSLLIIGYGFGDLYLNRIIERINQIHKNKKRIVIISYYSGDENNWVNDHRARHFIKTQEEYEFIAKAFCDENPLNNYSQKNLKNKEPLESKNKCARIYLHGFKDATINHSKEIFDFLTT